MTVAHRSLGDIRLTIAVLTFRRNEDIRAALPLLDAQASGIRHRLGDVRILVVDNDPDGGARMTVADPALAAELITTVVYAHEARPGISAARNRALSESGESDLLIFIDDDERPTEVWLSALVTSWDTNRVAGVVGPVRSTFATEPDPWIIDGGFFLRRRLADGTPVTVAATNNLLLDLAVVRAADLRFDEDFGMTGAEDTLFTMSLAAAGGRILWAADAMVIDVVPESRLTRRWVMQRAFSSGNSWSLATIRLQHGVPRLVARLALSAKGLVRVVGGGARWLIGIVLRRRTHEARGARSAARGWGMLRGALGYSYEEYKRQDAG